MKRVAPRPDENPDIVGIPQVVGIVIVRVEPQIVAIAVEVEHVGIAICIGMNGMSPAPPPLEYSWD